MSVLNYSSLSQVSSMLFGASDALMFATGSANDVAVSSGGISTSLRFAGVTLDFPTLNLANASQAGNVAFPDGSHLVTGTNGGDTIVAVAGATVTYGLAGDDHLFAGDGSSVMYGGSGSDSVVGGAGNDHLYGYGSVTGVDGSDTISGGDGGDYIQGNAGSDVLDGGSGDDRIYGGADNDLITGGTGNDTVNGNLGNDTIDGGTGNDLLRGGRGDDLVQGGDGNDVLMGDIGVDTLTGGAGADLFHFHGGDAATNVVGSILGYVDTITDFTRGEDHIVLDFKPDTVLSGSTSGTIDDALAYAKGLLSALNDSHAVAAVTFGDDTLLVYSSTGGHIADSAVDLHGIGVNQITTQDFI